MALLVFGALLVAFALVERRLERAWLTAPLVFTAAGWVFTEVTDADRLLGLDVDTVHLLAEGTLVLLLFHDASKLRLPEVRTEWRLAARLLFVALPLTVLAGYGTAAVLLPGLGVGLTLFVASALAPTDAALGAATVTNPSVPSRIRSLLNVESGLNDGLATPIVLIALAIAAEGTVEASGAVIELVVGAAVGIGLGWLGGRGVTVAHRRGWMTVAGRGIVMLVLPIIGYITSGALSGNGFIAAFVAGIAFAVGAGHLVADEAPETAFEASVDILGAAVWFVFGAAAGAFVAAGFGWGPVAFAVLSLTALRMLPVGISLLGSGLRPPTLWFLGWFGPRGLASLIFLLLSIEQLGSEAGIVDEAHAVAAVTVGLTVLLSVVAHGLSGAPLAERYGAWVHAEQPTVETEGVPS